MWGAFLYAGVVHYLTRGREPFTLTHGGSDWQRLKPAAECKEIEYPKPDNQVSFDPLSSLANPIPNPNPNPNPTPNPHPHPNPNQERAALEEAWAVVGADADP